MMRWHIRNKTDMRWRAAVAAFAELSLAGCVSLPSPAPEPLRPHTDGTYLYLGFSASPSGDELTVYRARDGDVIEFEDWAFRVVAAHPGSGAPRNPGDSDGGTIELLKHP